MESDGLSLLNPHPIKLSGPNLLHLLVAPASEAIAFEHLRGHQVSSFSYRHLHNAADTLAGRILRSRGHAEGQFVVPVLVRQSPELPIALLAILKAGGAFCPLNVDDPPDRIGFILSDVSATMVVVSEELAHLIPPSDGLEIIRVDSYEDNSTLEDIPHRISTSQDLAYIMYTSGSTGIPKGVEISHLAVTQALLAHDQLLPHFSRFLQFAAPTFDISVFEIFFTLLRGRTLIGADRSQILNDLPAVLQELKVDACELTPTVAAGLLRTRDRAPNLKLLLTIGEMLNESVVREFGGNDDRESILWAMYGPTEATIHCTLQPQFSSESSIHNIGRPLDTVSCFVLEPAQTAEQSLTFNVLPRGQIGELAVGGHQLANGYLNRREQTQVSFISSPYGRVYRTGDKARITADGTLECLGRLSEGQVKLRGQRLELGEVEAAVSRAPGCHGVVASVVDSTLVVFCAIDTTVTEDSILEACKRWLPRFMVPGVVILLDELPRLSSGKVDKKKLLSEFQTYKYPDGTKNDVSGGLSDSEEKILSVVSKVSNKQVIMGMTLAEAGIDSLTSIYLASALRATGFETNAAELLAFKTVAKLCCTIQPKAEKHIQRTESTGLSHRLYQIGISNSALSPVTDLLQDIFPCTPLQNAMLAETARDPQAYWSDIELEAAGGITVQRVTDAILEVIRQNDILRAAFVRYDGEYRTVIFKEFDPRQIHMEPLARDPEILEPDSFFRPLQLQILRDQAGGNGTKVLMRIHHAIYDGWSMDIILSDLSKLLRGDSLQPRQQFRHVVQFSRNISSKQFDNDSVFWGEYLFGWNKQVFPKFQSQEGSDDTILSQNEILDISPSAVGQAAEGCNCSIQVLFQAALVMVWGGLSGDTDVVMGSVLSGRTIPLDGVEGIMGPCIASMPLRIDLEKASSVRDILMSIKSSNRRIMEHLSLSLLEIKRLVGIHGGSLYDVLFVYQQALYSENSKPTVVRQVRHLDRLETKLLIEVEPQEDGFVFQATYHSSSVPTDVVSHLLRQMKEVFGRLLNNEAKSPSWIRDSIHSESFVDVNTVGTLYEETDLATLFEAAVTRSPTADALCFRTSFSSKSELSAILSFEDLNKRSNQIARLLIEQGVKPGHVVAIVMEKSPIFYASVLAIAKARCGYLPLTPATPVARVQEIFDSAGIKSCLTDKETCFMFKSVNDVIFIDVETQDLSCFSDDNVNIPADSSRLAYVIYTSGTTGAPKGVAVTQGNIIANILHLGSTYPTARGNPARLLQACSQAFDVSVFEIFFSWHMGMCLCSASNDRLFEDLEQAIRSFKITHLSLTPTVASLINPAHVPSVEFLVTAGEPLTSNVLDRWGETLWQGYGPSETTNICTVKKMKYGEHLEHLGCVFPNTSVVVLDPGSLDALPLGWVGEFCFGGDQVAAGYLHMSQLTAEKFIDHPKFGRIYRSGDRGRMLPDGSLIILGRIDDQLKLRGLRIEAKEISNVIVGISPAVEALTMLVHRHNDPSGQLASFYVCGNPSSEFEVLDMDFETQQSLFAHLLHKLPSYMVPSFLVPISRIPVTSNGKVDRQRLQSCFANLPDNYLDLACYVAGQHDPSDWSFTERMIANVISTFLEIPRHEIGRWTPFAKLGLHSISAIGVSQQLTTRVGFRVPISAILQNPTAAQLGRFILNAPRLNGGSMMTGRFPKSFVDRVCQSFHDEGHQVIEILPCSPLQEAMLAQGQEAYYNNILLHLHIEPDEMRQYWSAMVNRHGILRTCFVTTDDSHFPLAQVLLNDPVLPWTELTASSTSLDRAVQDHSRTLPAPLDTKTLPFSLAIIKDEENTFLSFICHHALYDGVAIENIWREVEALARGNDLPPTIPYHPFLEEMLKLPDDTEQFWTDHLRRFSPPEPFPKPHERRIMQCLDTFCLDLPYDEIHDNVHLLGVSNLSLYQAAWAQVLAVCFDASDVCFGYVVGGRNIGIDGIDRLVAPCFNTILVRKDISLDHQNIDLVKSFQQISSDLLPYQFTPLKTIQKIFGAPGRRLFDTLLILQPPFQEMDESIWTLKSESGEMDIPLVCEVVPHPSSNSVMVNMHYHQGSVEKEIISAIANAFKHFCRLMLELPLHDIEDRKDLPSDIRPLLAKLRFSPSRIGAVPEETHVQEHEWTESGSIIRQIFSDLSGVSLQKIGPNTTIFQLGLDSINAIQIASMLRGRGFAVLASDVIEHRSCESLAKRLLESQPFRSPELRYDLGKFSTLAEPQVRTKLPSAADVEAILPCTPIQCAMITSFLESHGEHYLNMVSYTMDTNLTTGDLVRSWTALRDCHPMLRTGFVPVQHNDSPFAMVRYRITPESATIAENAQVKVLDGEPDLSQWKRQTTSRILNALHLPPWSVAVSTGQSGLVMHILLHHSLYDAQSLESMLDGLSGLLKGQKPRLFAPIEPALQTMLDRNLATQSQCRKFWEAKSETTVVNKLPIMTPLREDQRLTMYHEAISSTTLSTLQSATKQQDVSIQAFIQAAWTRVLSSYLGEDCVVFGTILSGRTTDETKDAPFPCMVTVPVIMKNQYTNKELVRSMMDYNGELHKHQSAPLSQIQKWLGYPATKVFDTIIVYQKLNRDHVSERPWKRLGDDASVDYPISIEVEPLDDNKIRLGVTFFSDVLPMEQAKLLLYQFDAMMGHIATDPDGHEDGIYQTQPALFSITPPAMAMIPAPVELLHQFVEIRALSHPNDPALEFVSRFENGVPSKQSWTYAELDAMGNRVANMLRSLAPVRSIIAILFNKCPEAYISILGILKSGCSFVALDPGAPQARKEFIMSDSQASCLLVSSNAMVDFQVSSTVVRIDLGELTGYSAERRDLGLGFTPSATCYCLYTSGTTGTPKGCEITHENSVQAMMAFQDLFKGHWEHDSRWLQFAALHFDVSVLEQYWSWSVGITVVAAPRDLILDDLIASINRLEITHIDLTPSLARLTHPDEVPGLCKGVFITGGESLKQEILDAWGPKAVIYNAYGPTEATIGVTMYQRVPVNGRPSNIGRQFLNVGSYVFRKGTEIPVLRGAVGELCVSGKLVGKGYLNRQELTLERFPTLSEFGEKIYRTGDLVRILHDGCFDFLGRADDQVKLRGQRLEIGEINHVIRTGAPEVKDVATIVARRENKDVLVSFLVRQGSTERGLHVLLQGEEDLGVRARAACRAKLPGYMIPTYFLTVPYIPLSPNNKVEAKELQRLFNDLPPGKLLALMTATTSRRVANAKEAGKVIKILADFCQLDESSIKETTSIFDLGIDSIVALQLSTLFKDRGHKSCSPAILLRNPIVADLCDALSNHEATVSAESLVWESKQAIRAVHHRYLSLVCRSLGVNREAIEYIAPCTALQQGIISKSIASTRRGLYFNTFELVLGEDISMESFKRAWTQMTASQAILRTRFIKTADGYVQAALKEDPSFHWQERDVGSEEDIDTCAETARQEWIERNDDDFKHPFELVMISGPSIKRRLLIHIFHALYDGNSFDLMMQELGDRYQDKEPLAGPSFLESLCHGPLSRHDGSRDFWVAHLKDCEPSPMHMLRIPEGGSPSSAVKVMDGSQLEEVRRKHNVTFQAVVMAIWIHVLGQYLRDGVSIGIVVAGRSMNLPHVERTMGPLFNTIPFFHKTHRDQDWSSLILKCHDFMTAILPFQHVPLKSIQKWCSGGRPIFDNVLVFGVDQDASGSGTDSWHVRDGPLNPDYPLALDARRMRNGDLRLCLVAQSNIADDGGLQDMLERIEDSVGPMIADQPLGLNAGHHYGIAHVEPERGSVDVDGPANDDKFAWTDEALTIRHTVAAVANVSAEDIGATKTMLELGLDSIDMIQLSTKLRSKDVNISASEIMRHQTIARMSHEIQSRDTEPPTVSVDVDYTPENDLFRRLWEIVESKGFDMGDIDTVLPPTHLQESMVAGMVHSNFAWYFNHDLLEIEEGADIQRLRTAWQHVIDVTPILRTGFVEVEDAQLDMGYCQIIYKSWGQGIEPVQLTSLDKVDGLVREAKARAQEKRGMDRLFQLKWVTCQGRHYFLVSMAHALYDGWSLSLIYRRLESVYNRKLRVRDPAVQLLARRVMRSQTEDGNTFWTSHLNGASRAMIAEKEGEGGRGFLTHRAEQVSYNTASGISAFCKKHSITLQTLLQASWAAVLAHRTRSMDVTFGIVLSGRDFGGAEHLLFPLINTVPLRCILHGTSNEFLGYLEAAMMDVREHQTYPLRRMRTTDGTPAADLFNTLFILQKTPHQASRSRLLVSVDGSSAVDYPVCVEAEEVGDDLIWRVACQAKFLTEAESRQLVEDLDHVLAFMMRSEFALLSFVDGTVSICGLPHVALASEQAADTVLAEQTTDIEETWSETGLEIRAVLSQVAGVDEDSITNGTSLYHLGLDSISALKVCALLRKRDLYINPRDLIKASCIEQMASAATSEQARQDGQARELKTPQVWRIPEGVAIDAVLAKADISRRDVDFILPALPMQVYMISAWQNAQGAVFFPEFRVTADQPISSQHIQSAWESLVVQLPILRTCLVATQSQEIPFVQVVLKPGSAVFTQGNVLPLAQLYKREDFEETNEGQTTMWLKIHHALYDGFSLREIIRRFKEQLADPGQTHGHGRGVKRWSRFAIRPTEMNARSDRRAFWMKYLPGMDRTNEDVVRPKRGQVSFLKRAALQDITRVRALASSHGISIQAVFFAAYALALMDRVYHPDEEVEVRGVVFGIYLANRGVDEDLPHTYPTLNLVPLKVGATRSQGVLEVARAIQEDIHAISAEGRAQVGLWEIAAWTGVRLYSFVNFLHQPAESNLNGLEGPQAREFSESAAPWGDGVRCDNLDLYPQVWDNQVRRLLPVAYDVEASIRDGRVDIGVFGTPEGTARDDIMALIDDIVKYIESA